MRSCLKKSILEKKNDDGFFVCFACLDGRHTALFCQPQPRFDEIRGSIINRKDFIFGIYVSMHTR
jgi:hypothetical protein